MRKPASLLIFLLICTFSVLEAQPSSVTTSRREGFVLYRCDTTPQPSILRLAAYLANASGGALLPAIDSVLLEAVELGEAQLESSARASRRPVRIVLVLDATSTMPLLPVINVVSTQMFPQLEFNDEVALISFSQNVSPITAFFTDKNRLVNEHMLGLRVSGGTNRLFDAIRDAVAALVDRPDRRNIVLVITDSNRRDVPQTSVNDIIAAANPSKVQIYTVGVQTEDTPDEAELRTLAERTNGFSWYFRAPGSVDALEGSLQNILNQFVNNLNQEVAFNVNVSELDLQGVSEITFKVTLTTNTGAVLSDTIVCPVPTVTLVPPQPTAIPNNITFVPVNVPPVVTEPFDIAVQVETGLPDSEQLIVFLQNGEVVQASRSPIYTLVAPALPPGIYNITAQLRNQDNIVFATTPGSLTINTQQQLTLTVVEGSLANLDAPLRLNAQTTSTLPLPDVRFTLSRATQPTEARPLGAGSAPTVSGLASLSIASLRQEIQRHFPDAQADEAFLIGASIPAPVAGQPALALAEPLTVTYRPLPPPPFDTELALIVVLCVALFLLNVIAFQRVRRARIRRMIARPDGYDLPNRLMAVTVYRDALKHTVTLTRKTMTIGRGSANDINIGDDNKVSRQHGVIMWRRNDWYYSNRKPDVYVRIGGRRVRGYKLMRLEPVTEIEMGDARVFFHTNSQQDISELTRTNL
ncbi:MAG: VWA domain-containing protein [Anaerolineae bacterium]